MPSNLYQMAVVALSDDERAALAEFEGWMESFLGTIDRPVQGRIVLENFRIESHFLGDDAFGECRELTAFLQRCLEAHAGASTDEEWRRSYEKVCADHEGKGLRIERDHLPDILLRYTASRFVADRLIERTLGSSARIDLFLGRTTPEYVFTRVDSSWDPARLEDSDRLAHEERKVAFATFEHPGGAPRDDARAMIEALALPVRSKGPQFLLELAYDTDSVGNHRFPTVADAGWFHEFQPAPEVGVDSSRPETCCGWSRPLGSHPAQPELVHDNESMKILNSSPRYVGTVIL